MSNSVIVFKFTTLASAMLLAGCLGGGGSSATLSGPNNQLFNNIKSESIVKIDSIDPAVGISNKAIVSDIFAQDFNNNGTQEVLIAGRMSQPATIVDWKNYNLNIYGWDKTGSFANETSLWLPNQSNQIVGTEPSVNFGDFDGNGKVDVFISPGTDTTIYGPAVVLYNDGNQLRRQEFNLGEVWSHHSTILDINSDNIKDVMIVRYGNSTNGTPILAVGKANQSFDFFELNGIIGSSGVAAGDFLNNGSVSIVVTDSSTSANDTNLYSIAWNNGAPQLQFVRNLPTPVYELETTKSHDIRAYAKDFNNDGKLDVIVSSRPGFDTNTNSWPQGTKLQFLANDGSGNFTDVTNDVLVGYNTNLNAAYNISFLDINNDGREDIFLSQPGAATQSSQILIQQNDGKYVSSYGDQLRIFMEEVVSKQSESSNFGNVVNVVKGPNNKLFLVSTVNYYDDQGDFKHAVFLGEIGENGTITAASSIDEILRVWPYLTRDQAVQILSATSQNFNGYATIDISKVFSPVGALQIQTSAGQKVPLWGSIQGISFDQQASKIVLFDGFQRTFSASLGLKNQQTNWQKWHTTQTNQNIFDYGFSQNLTNSSMKFKDGFMFSENNLKDYSFGTPYYAISDKFSLRMQYTNLSFSPWIGMNGMWGNVKGSDIFEVTSKYNNGMFQARGGLMYASTKFTPGLVTSVSPILAAWGEIGFQEDQNWVYAGIFPKVIHSQIEARIPTGVDGRGKVSYSTMKGEINDQVVGYVRFGHNILNKKHYGVDLNGIITNKGMYNVNANFRFSF